MNKSLHPLIILFWGHILFVRVQCRGTLGILNESKLSERKGLCFRRCDIGFQADDKETLSKETFGRRSCYEECLREEGKTKSVETKRGPLAVDGQKTSLLKRIRRSPQDGCFDGSASSKTPAMVAKGKSVVFRELEDKRKYKGTAFWKPLQNISANWTGYKIVFVYSEPPKFSEDEECAFVAKNVTQYSFPISSDGIADGSMVYVTVVSFPHSDNLNHIFNRKRLACKVPAINGCQEDRVTTSPPTVAATTRVETEPVLFSTAPISDLQYNNTAPKEPSDQRKFDNRTALVVAALVAACVAAVALLLVYVYYRRRKKYKPIRLVNPLTDLKFEFDAFIIYSSHDSEWVVKTLLPTLEEKHGLKCCVHYRDFTLGVPIRKNMVDSVYKCKKTVAVVSTNFFNSNYCGSELDYALHRLMEKNDDSLVVIKLDDVDRNKLPKELQNRSYVDYPKSIEKETWEKKLIKCLKVTS